MTILFILSPPLVIDTSQCAVDRGAEPVDDHVDVIRRRDVGRREQDVVAAAAVHRPAGRVAGKPALERGGLDLLVELEGGIERLAAGAVGDQLDGLEQAAPADVADMAVIAEALGQPPLEMTAELPDAVEQCSSAMIRCTSSAAAQASGCAR